MDLAAGDGILGPLVIVILEQLVGVDWLARGGQDGREVGIEPHGYMLAGVVGVVGVDDDVLPGGIVDQPVDPFALEVVGGPAIEDGHALGLPLGAGVGQGLGDLSLLAQSSGLVVELAGGGRADQGLDGAGVVGELGDEQRPG